MVSSGHERERHRRAVPHFGAGGIDGLRQALAAERFRRGKPVPAALAPGAVGVLEAGRGDDGAVVECRPDAVAVAVERGDDFGGDAAGFADNGLDIVHAEVAEQAGFERLRQARAVAEGETHVGEGGLIGHGSPPGSPPRRYGGVPAARQGRKRCRRRRSPRLTATDIIIWCARRCLWAYLAPARRRPRQRLIRADRIAMVRPPRPTGTADRALGRSQVVRQRILIPPFPGSNPGAPANAINSLGISLGHVHSKIICIRRSIGAGRSRDPAPNRTSARTDTPRQESFS